jgi:hypothetical protein
MLPEAPIEPPSFAEARRLLILGVGPEVIAAGCRLSCSIVQSLKIQLESERLLTIAQMFCIAHRFQFGIPYHSLILRYFLQLPLPFFTTLYDRSSVNTFVLAFHSALRVLFAPPFARPPHEIISFVADFLSLPR